MRSDSRKLAKESPLRKTNPEPIPVFLRVHTRIKDEKPRRDGRSKLPDVWAHYALVFDCETTTDIRQDLNFAWWRFCELKDGAYVCQQEGVVYADGLDEYSIALIRSFAQNKQAEVEDGCPEEICVESRTEFVDGKFWTAIQAGAVIVCFNSPFDLSRLALEYRPAKRRNSGWAMVMWRYEGEPDQLKPYLRIKPKDSRSAFISLAGGDPNNRVIYGGRFLDLSVLCAALRNRHLSLNDALGSFGLKGKLKHEPTGRVTEEELRYGRRDVERTVALLSAMKREYDGFALDLSPESAMSPASITKAFLEKMGVEQPSLKFNLSDDVLGKCMQGYYGGRSEIRIRHQEVPVVVCDTTSEYPSVAGLLDLWKLLIAANIRIEDCTEHARNIVRKLTIDSVLDPAKWKELGFFGLVKPSGDMLPVRALYRENGDTNIGLNPLSSDVPIWYAGPDLAGSKLLTGRAPEIIEAFRLIPEGIQSGLKKVTIGTRELIPQTDDFFRVVIEERKKLAKSHPHYLLLKIIANALYGIFAELNKEEFGKNRAKDLEIFSGGEVLHQKSTIFERPGKYQFPPAAALITAGGRLMLAILEKLVSDLRGTYLLTDTDSMLFVASRKGGLIACPGGREQLANGTPAIRAITWKQVKDISERLNRLNPYNQEIIADILKIEECNRDRNDKPHQLFGIAISAKRYVVYKRQKKEIEIIKPSEHGLGIVFVPDRRPRYKPINCLDQENSYPKWIVEAWEHILSEHFRNIDNPESALVSSGLWFGNLPAIMRVRVTTPNVLKALRTRDPGAGKPYNFAHSPILVDAIPNCTLIAPASKNFSEWSSRDYIEIHTGEAVVLGAEYHGRTVKPQTLSNVIWRHYLHREDKSLGPEGQPCKEYTRGLLLRRPVQAMIPFGFMGKEIERRAQEGEDVAVLEGSGPIQYGWGRRTKTRSGDPALIAKAKGYGFRELMRESEASQHSVKRFLDGGRVHPTTRAKLKAAIERLDQRTKARGLVNK